MPDTVRHSTVSDQTALQIPSWGYLTVHQTAEGLKCSRGYTIL